MLRSLRLSAIFSLCTIVVFAREEPFAPPIPAEIAAGHHYTGYQHIINKPITKSGKLYFLNITVLSLDYESSLNNEVVIQSYLNQGITYGISIAAGGFYGNFSGFSPSISLNYSNAGKNHLLVIFPRIGVRRNTEYEFFGMFEYKPRISEKVGLYSRIQLLNNFDNSGHERSYQMIRLGVSTAGIEFGLATTFDQYGPDPEFLHNTGIFIRKEI